MRCPFCGFPDTGVKDSRPGDENVTIRRRRFCGSCHSRFTTVERVQLRELVIVKKNGHMEPFNQEKLMRSFQRALHKRPIETKQVEQVVSDLVRQLETSGTGEIPSSVVGKKVMEALSTLDAVGYVRFASVYQDFRAKEDFEVFIETIADVKK